MTAVLYIHGFLSSPKSHKAQITGEWLSRERPDCQYLSPQFSSYPDQAASALLALTSQYKGQCLSVIGSSLGGFWATWLVEKQLAQRAVLINPAVAPQHLIFDHIGTPLKNYYTDDVYLLEESHAKVLEACYFDRLQQPEKYWLMVQTGDETLDYRLAVDKYAACKQTIETGGSHTFEGYENWLPQIMSFLLQAK